MKIDYLKFFIACAEQKKNLTEVIKLANVSTSILTSIKHEKNISAATAGKLADVLGVPVEKLLAIDKKGA